MKIIIAGAGETGCHLASMLSAENQDTILMGSDRAKLAELDAARNFMTAEGHAVSIDDLIHVGVPGADLFVAVTPVDTVNIVSCQLAKECGAKRTIARVDNRDLATGIGLDMLKRHGVDMTIYPEMVAAREIARFIHHSWVSEWFQLHHGELLVVGVRMKADSSLNGRELRDISSDSETQRWFHVSAVARGGRIIIPRGDTRLIEGDIIYFSILPKDLDRLAPLCGQSVHNIGRIMISGAGRVTENLLGLMASRRNITVIDPDEDRCRAIAEKFHDVVVVNASASDIVTLNEEGIDGCNLFLALTGSSETNIVSCMVAREHGVASTLARIEELQYIPEAESLSIDKIINKKLLNAGSILNMLLDSGSDDAKCLSLGDAEVAGMVACNDSKIVSRPICELSLPRELTISGLIRNGVAQLVEGSTHIMPGDHVLIFFSAGALHKVERLFHN